MNSSNIHQINTIKQDATKGESVMHGMALTRLLHNIIREYGKQEYSNYSIDANSIDMTDRKLVVSHFESAEWYEWACEAPSRINELFSEHAAYLQKLLDDECYVVYCDDMEEMGMARCTHPDNDEVYWLRR